MMITGVKIKTLKVHADQRGDFREILKVNEGLMDRIEQVSISTTLPGIIKAFHWHEHQDDVMYVLSGNVLLGLYDPRQDSPSKGESQRIFLGDSVEPQIVLIPRLILHGYRVLGNRESSMLYIMNNSYNPSNPDEKRVAFDDAQINFDWDAK